jgi:hypothetical protein
MLTKIAASAAAVSAVLDALVLLDVVELSGEQIGGMNLAIMAVGSAIHAWFNPAIPFGPKE